MQTILDSWKAQGYYLLIQTGTYKQQPVKEYSLVRDITNNEREIKCILNKAAAKIAEDYLPTAHAIKKCNWLTPPEQTLHYNFQNNKEPLKLTF
jgi:hypothetical protein